MDASRLQAQVRALSREVGALKDELGREGRRRERLAVRAKECEELLAAAEAKTKSLSYVNLKLEQEVATLKDRAQASGAKSRSGLEGLRQRLAEVEASVAARAVEAQRQLQGVKGMVQELAGEALPLAVVVAAAGKQAAAAQPRGSARRETRPSPQKAALRPTQLHGRFSQLLAALAKLSETITGHSGDGGCGAATTAAPLLLTAPDGSTTAVHRREGSGASSSTQAPAAAAAAARVGAAADAEKEMLRAQVRKLQAELAAAHSRASGSIGGGDGGGGGRVQAAMRQLEAVVPRYRAAASALQSQVAVLKERLAATGQERAQLQEQVTHWQGRAQQLEAALGEATAKAHAQEAQALALSTQAQSHSERLSGDMEALRQRCAELGGRLRAAQQEAARLQAAAAEKDRLVATQQGTIRRLEATIADQQADIRSALDLVTSRGGAAGTAAADALLHHGGGGSSDWDDLGPAGLGLGLGLGLDLAAEGCSGAAAGRDLDAANPWPFPLGVEADLLAEPLLDPETAWSAPGAALQPAPAGGSCADSGALGAVSVSPRPGGGHYHSPAVSSLAPQPQQSPGRSRQAQARHKSGEGGASGRGLASIENEIAGLEDALRTALAELNV